MYCRSCGNELQATADICMKCGVPRGRGNGYCPFCGARVNPDAVVCVSCGKMLNENTNGGACMPDNARSGLAAGLLGIFLGAFGVHNFYLSFKKKAVVQLILTVVGIALMISCLMLFAFAGAFAYEDAYGALLTVVLGVVFAIVGAICICVSSLWSFIEAIIILCGGKKYDGKGVPINNV